jgi:hypothetical protein
VDRDFRHLKAVAWLHIRYGITLLIFGQPMGSILLASSYQALDNIL